MRRSPLTIGNRPARTPSSIVSPGNVFMGSRGDSGLTDFDEWFKIPSPGYTIFWTMPETHLDPNLLLSSWIKSAVPKSEGFLAHCTRSNIDGFLEGLSSFDPRCPLRLLSLGANLHFVDSYSARLELFGQPLDHNGLDIRYVTETRKARGAGTVSEAFRELREEYDLSNFIGVENSLTDLAMDMGEFQHTKLFSDLVSKIRSRQGTMIGMADWYSHGEIYKANMIHLGDASILWGITSGSNKMKYLLPIKRSMVSPASSFEPKPYLVGPSTFKVLSSKAHLVRNVQPQENCYR